MKVTIFGTGYVGLVQAAVLAEVGHQVCCVDVDDERIAALRLGQIPFYEPGLATLVESHLASGRLSFTVDPAIGVAHADLLLIAVGTPAEEDGSADLQHVLAVADTIGRLMSRPKLVVTKSTVPVGTAQQVREHIELQLAERGLTLACEVAANPEFLKEGAAVNDCMRPDRIIIGCDSERALEQLRALYAPFNRNHDRIVVMDLRSAELTKYAANAMLATKISFMNEMAALAEELGADIEAVRQGMGADPRIGYHFIYPGCGYGGSCFPKDIKSLLHTAASVGCDAPLLAAVEQVNQRQQQKMAQTLRTRFGPDLRGRTFALWGMAFKPGTDDMRDAPSRPLLAAIWAAGGRVQVFDPKAMGRARQIYGQRPDLLLCPTQEAALEGADALLICTEWQAFRAPDFQQLKALLNQPVIIDGRNLYEPRQLSELGFDYYAIGRPHLPAKKQPANTSCNPETQP
ncbi:UDP-glucose dehydrogenase family protein [Aeromonas veronii]|uniref:UDP-glucose dehydrogenase family protein n=1 Tax=Aeromonas veronii TaxID=654 RepID=UPI00187EA6A8|nr:UDP-glucose/GDP-mannose dehydrogenase family protein [Aeromonas veronii]MBE8733374.1 UDP-glucose/GDP-mannose dehydrogenase family protein [Aeromonas veronii]MBE8738876.1 UDP-glucose/GDP-mannose dehydrogenase family protein [Aeromonas veronii]MBE8742125.1 UDP-glucose/GDP-mannose dehydrogenase family protein [Aeromonas veronii]MBE8763641.1 UDP-glucose/GDP-mannose dehydrogenase family protein [Aeromonas veronii]MBE8840498.1 UDP-glucose/GDP-mannose dehydrogenase family protein [Aeromonas veroni